jgi:cysteine-rich repeat protein
MRFHVIVLLGVLLAAPALLSAATMSTTTTILTLSICGNLIVDDGEQCDIPGETGEYSQTIAGRQCDVDCSFGPYCGDGVLQTPFGEQCDDGNNEDGDFCSALCKVEPAGSGGGGSSGGGSRGGGGSNEDFGDTLISIIGKAYPSVTLNFLLDTESVGTVRTDSSGDFEFSTEASPGTATLGIWANDDQGVRSITLNNTFDVTQGAVTNLNGVILPPTISVDSQNVNPGDVISVFGQAVPGNLVELHVNNSEIVATTTSTQDGDWSIEFDAGRVSIAEHILRARSVVGNPPLTSESSFSTSLQLFVGVDGQASTPSDLNRDGSVNLIDFSILIFWWGTAGGDSDPPADINNNGNVGLEDFSILLFNWTG